MRLFIRLVEKGYLARNLSVGTEHPSVALEDMMALQSGQTAGITKARLVSALLIGPGGGHDHSKVFAGLQRC